MTAIFNNLQITKVENIGFNEIEEQYLTNLFATTVEHLVPTLAREVWLHLNDFADSKDYNLDGFLLMIISKTIYNQSQWHGIVQGDKKRLKVIAILEKD
jgi:hypothetical protein